MTNGRLEVESDRLIGYGLFTSDDVIMFYAKIKGKDIDFGIAYDY